MTRVVSSALQASRNRGRAKVNLLHKIAAVDPIKLAWEALHAIPFPVELAYEHRGKFAKGNSRHWNISPEKLHKRPK